MSNFAKKVLAKARVSPKSDSELDIEYYREAYPDLESLNNAELINHWSLFGSKEGRYPNAEKMAQASGLNSAKDLDFEFDLEFYLACYKDVRLSGVESELQARLHWLKYGEKEERCRTLKEWLSKYNLQLFIELDDFNLELLMDNNPNLSFEQVIGTLCGHVAHRVAFYKNPEKNSELYLNLAEMCFTQLRESTHGYQAALSAARIAYEETKTAAALEAIANYHNRQGDYATANSVYRQIKSGDYKVSLLFESNYIDNLLKQNKVSEALDVLESAINEKPELSFLHGKLDSVAEQFFLENAGEIQTLALLDKRDELIQLYQALCERVYSAFYCTFNNNSTMSLKPKIDTDRVLIVGDYHVTQCIRYRIDQKTEQLESQGKQVTTIDWTALSEHQNELALHDVVIFYRVPAVPSVLKAMAQVNANGKASFYEIDDLLFEKSYPAPIETFGNYIGLDTHIELRTSMARFRAAATFCRYGISSTQLLCDKLQPLVMGKHCILHRNGLDKLSVIRNQGKTTKATVDIFYGSGTQAHNSDFIEQALPALESVLTKHKHARLIIAGYLQLPAAFVQKFEAQLKQLPPVKSVKAYWSFLEQADINLAVLHDDEINGCKSELKWFEAACFSIPSVVSTTANYRDVIKHGEDAYIASTKREWEESLGKLISSSSARKAMADKAQKRVQAEYSVEALGLALASNLSNLLDRPVVKQKKKLALVNVFFPPQAIGGATRVLADNFDVLQKQYGDEFELVVFTSDDHCTTPYQLTTYQHQGVTVYRSTILYRENMDWHPKDPEMYTVFEQFLEAEQPDLVHFHCVQRLTASVVEATKDSGIPYMVTAHDAWWISDHQFLIDGDDNVYLEGHPDIYAPRTLPNNVSLGDSIERVQYYQELLNGAEKLLTVSESFADIYKKNGYPQIEVNKNGISSTVNWQSKETSYTDKVVCGHIGGMANHKGYFILKEAVEKEQPKNIEMLIVDHSKPDGYEHKTTWGHVPVTFIGRMDQTNVAKLYQKLDVLFAPSMWPESYGLVTREAAACSCWVVASELGGIGEDVIEGSTGLRITPDIEGLSKAINDIDRNVKKFKQSIKQADIRLTDRQVEELVGYYK
ncbi:glycosyltransferase [Vibrio sp. 10N.261.52.F3]|uniref:glycosyltransferase n=1 Tax=Vibrio sp. 10N.261.52.F3 TaxID=3229683 RepID=UPI003551039D